MTSLKQWREKERLTLEEVGDLVGYSAAMLCRIEQGVRRPSREAKVRIARRLGVPIRALFPVEETNGQLAHMGTCPSARTTNRETL